MRSRRHQPLRLVVMAATVASLFVLTTGSSWAQVDTSTAELFGDERVYDRTGSSLTSSEADDLRRRLDDLVAQEGADGIVLVRAQDATPEETLDQVEALQQRWVAVTGVDQDVAFAILINRNPTDDNDARVGIFVGSTFDDGNVPPDEQVAIVEDELIPPLRDGDVHASLVAGLERLGNSIRIGPPTSAFDDWAADVARTWFPWALVGIAVAGIMGALALFRRRQTTDQVQPAPTTVRPGWLEPAVAGALVAGAPRPSAIAAMLLDLAARGAVAIEAEDDGGTFSSPLVKVRLLDGASVRGPVETALWQELERRTDDDGEATSRTVPGTELKKLAASHRQVDEAIEQRLRVEGWIDDGAGAPRAGLFAIGMFALVLAVVGAVVAGAGGSVLPLGGVVVLLGLTATGFVMVANYSRLSSAGQRAALPWRSYRDGLAEAAEHDPASVDLDATLPDLVAMDLGPAINERLEELGESERLPRFFAAGDDRTNTAVSAFPWWLAFNGSTAPAGGAGGAGTVSGGGAGGGGGAAGST